jgi:transcription termination factor NusB
MIEGLTKEKIDEFKRLEDECRTLILERGAEIIEKAEERGVELNISKCDDVSLYDDDFVIAEYYSSKGESWYDYSEEIPIDAFYSDEALEKYFDSVLQEIDDKDEQLQQDIEKYERSEYERLKAKYEGK